MTWLINWNYRTPITISNAGSTLSDYQISVTIDTAGLITAGKMQSNCNDIRFTSSDGSTLLNYWIESGCNTSSTKIWVNIPSILSGSTIIYLYYGNSGASAASNGTNTFPLFDDFESYAVNTENPDGWNHYAYTYTGGYGSVNYSQGVKTDFAHNGTKSYNLYAWAYYTGYTYNDLKINVPTTEMLEGWIFTNDSGGSGGRDWHTTAGFLVVYKYSGGTFHSIYYQMRKVVYSGYYTSINFYGPDNTWHARDVEIVADTIALNTWTKLTRNLRTDFEAQSGWGTWASVTGLEIHLMSFGTGGGDSGNYGWTNAYFDDVRVRKYTSTEPTTSIGTEETPSPSPPNITATDITVTPSGTPCIVGICTITIVVRWSNSGGTDGTVIPNIKIDTVSQIAHAQRTVIAGSYIDETFIISGLSVGTHSICPDPN